METTKRSDEMSEQATITLRYANGRESSWTEDDFEANDTAKSYWYNDRDRKLAAVLVVYANGETVIYGGI